MQAIITKYLGPTDKRGARIKASSGAGSITIPYPFALSNDDVHAKAAKTLCAKLGWTGTLVIGHFDDGRRVFVFAGYGDYRVMEELA